MSPRELLLKRRCAAFATTIARLDLRSLTIRQRQVAKHRIAGLSLDDIGRRLQISPERARQIEARLQVRARLLAPDSEGPE